MMKLGKHIQLNKRAQYAKCQTLVQINAFSSSSSTAEGISPERKNVMKSKNISATSQPRTLFDKIWDSHVVDEQPDGNCLLFIDRHLIHEVTSPQAFEGLTVAGRSVRRRDCSLVTPDHNVTTSKERVYGKKIGDDEASLLQLAALDENAVKFNLPYFPLRDIRQGIVHIVGPEQGFTLPGLTIVCGDSHTATHGAFGSLAHGIGTSEVEHVLATQTLQQRKGKNMRVTVNGNLGLGVTAKDIVLAIIGKIGTAGGNGHVIEYDGDAIRSLSMEGRMTVCNMSIEGGARAGLVAPDEITFAYLKGRPMAPKGEMWDQAVRYWKTLKTDAGAKFDKQITLHANDIAPQVTWGTNPEQVVPIIGQVPDPNQYENEDKRKAVARALQYMGLKAGTKMEDIKIDTVFVGSCTNGRIEDIRELAKIMKGNKVKQGIRAMLVPGSGLVKKQAEKEGLIKVLEESGFDVREPGCSMCLGMNGDQLKSGERCASTSNRNFESRQGPGGRTHLVSPGMAGAAAITGRLADVRQFGVRSYSTQAVKKQGGLEPFTKLTGIAAPFPQPNVDTDLIIPARFLKTIKRSGLGKSLFDSWRYESGTQNENKDFILNKQPYRSSKILVVGENFGCGSSREHAPWALLDFGVKCLIGSSFADIFYQNCFKNAMLPIVLPKEQVDILMEEAKKGNELTVDLSAQKITTKDGKVSYDFNVDPFRKHCLLNGLDDIGLTLQKEDKIAAYENWRKQEFPWL